MQDQSSETAWRDGVPIALRFDDPYFSLQDGLEETRHVFLAGNDLPARFSQDLVIAELGFGTGLNFLATWQAWRAAQIRGRLRFVSFEAFPLSRGVRATALEAFPELAALAAHLDAAALPGPVELEPGVSLEIVQGDARMTLPQQNLAADIWYLDGFSPAKNPEMWGDDLLRAVGAKTRTGGTFATYTAAGHVRRALAAAGFTVARVPGFGRKRHMSRGVKAGP